MTLWNETWDWDLDAHELERQLRLDNEDHLSPNVDCVGREPPGGVL